MANQLKQRYDIIINGGGIIGFTLLNLVLKSPLLNKSRVLLIEQAAKPISHNPVRPSSLDADTETKAERHFSNRVSSITGASKLCLERLGVWDKIKPFSKEVRAIEVWNYDYSHRIQFNSSGQDSTESEPSIMFSVVENNRLSSAILRNIYENHRGDDPIAWNHTLESLGESSEDGLVDVVARSIERNEEVRVSAPLVLGCDGYNSKVRTLSEIPYREIDLKKKAVVGTVKMSPTLGGSPVNDIAYQRFSAQKDTVVALLPLDSEHSSFVISAPDDYSEYLTKCDNETFKTEVNELLSTKESPPNILLKGLHDITNVTFDGLQGLLRMLPPTISPKQDLDCTSDFLNEAPQISDIIESSRASFPLFFGTTTPRMTASLSNKEHCQIALLGDSTHRVHPLAGQGLNLGIQDTHELVKQLETALSFGERLFTSDDHYSLNRVLKKYECNRQTYVAPMSATILGMPTLFKLLPSRFVTTVNMCNQIKSTSVRVANGCM